MKGNKIILCNHYNKGFCYFFDDTRTEEFCENMCEHNDAETCSICEHFEVCLGESICSLHNNEVINENSCCEDFLKAES